MGQKQGAEVSGVVPLHSWICPTLLVHSSSLARPRGNSRRPSRVLSRNCTTQLPRPQSHCL